MLGYCSIFGVWGCNFIEFMLSDFNKQIKKSANILLLESHSDSYLLFITAKKHSKNLTKLKSDFWRFYELTNKPNAKIYTIYCPNCNNMNVWELAFDGTTPDNEECDSCHTPLWDDNGNPCQGVDVEIDDVYLTDYD